MEITEIQNRSDILLTSLVKKKALKNWINSYLLKPPKAESKKYEKLEHTYHLRGIKMVIKSFFR